MLIRNLSLENDIEIINLLLLILDGGKKKVIIKLKKNCNLFV